jgi:hypothetical protein
MLALVDLHLHAGSAGRDIEGLIPGPFFDVGFCAVDGLECAGCADRNAVCAIANDRALSVIVLVLP